MLRCTIPHSVRIGRLVEPAIRAPETKHARRTGHVSHRDGPDRAADQPRGACWFGACSRISTRRFWARPCAVASEAIGWLEATPVALRRLGATPRLVRYWATLAARCCDSGTLMRSPPVLSVWPTMLAVMPELVQDSALREATTVSSAELAT